MKLSYDTAKRLKDAGFPQPDECVQITDGNSGEYCRVPTLSELIEACGEQFDGLILNRGPLLTLESKWSCAGSRHIGLGFTPEEAVANLYLALHEKETK